MSFYCRVAAIIVQDGKFLLVGHDGGPAEYWTPGGKVEEGETEIEAIIREVREETGLVVTKAEFFNEYKTPSPFSKKVTDITRAYLVKTTGKVKPGMEITRTKWATKKEILKNKNTDKATELITKEVEK